MIDPKALLQEAMLTWEEIEAASHELAEREAVAEAATHKAIAVTLRAVATELRKEAWIQSQLSNAFADEAEGLGSLAAEIAAQHGKEEESDG